MSNVAEKVAVRFKAAYNQHAEDQLKKLLAKIDPYSRGLLKNPANVVAINRRDLRKVIGILYDDFMLKPEKDDIEEMEELFQGASDREEETLARAAIRDLEDAAEAYRKFLVLERMKVRGAVEVYGNKAWDLLQDEHIDLFEAAQLMSQIHWKWKG